MLNLILPLVCTAFVRADPVLAPLANQLGTAPDGLAAWLADEGISVRGDHLIVQAPARAFEPTAAALEVAVRNAGLEPRSIAPLPGSEGGLGWALVEIDPVDVDAVRLAVARLAADPSVRFAGPVLRHADVPNGDGWGAPQPRLLACGAAGDAGLVLAAAAERAPELEVVADRLGGIPGAVVLFSPERDGFALLATVAALDGDARVDWAEPDWHIAGRNAATPNDPLFTQQWAHSNTGQSGGVADIDLETLEAWDLTTGAATVPILVIDTGVDLAHPDLNALGGQDFTDDGGMGGLPENPCDNHGTWVAGCSSALKDNGTGVVGASPASPILSARAMISTYAPPICPGSWSTDASWTVNALDWGIQNGARITVNSNSYGFTSAAIEARYVQAETVDGVLNFASSGNSGATTVSYPGSLDAVNSIGAIDRDGTQAVFSSAGPKLAFVGPGVDIETTDRAGFLGGSVTDYIGLNGTSFATPLVAGVAALVRASDPTLTPDEVELILAATAADLGPTGRDDQFGQGLPRALAAVELALGQRDAILADKGTMSLLTGGVQTLELFGGSGAPGSQYLVLGSGSGTTPGITVDGFLLPLVPDNWLDITIVQANSGIFGNTFSVFDGAGRATATLTLPGNLNPFLAGLVLNHTFVRIEWAPFPVLAAAPPEPAALEFVP